MLKRIGIILSVFTIIAIGALGYIGNFFYDLALNPTVSKEEVFENQPENPNATVDVSASILYKTDWLEAATKETLEIMSFDGLKLYGYVVANEIPSHDWVICVHGYTSRAQYLSFAGERFSAMGFNVLLPELRGHGVSEGEYIGMGYHDKEDIKAFIEVILARDPEARILLYGVSMGASTVMMMAGDALPVNVKAVIEDCGYTGAYQEFAFQLRVLYHLPAHPIMDSANIVTRIRAGYFLSDAEPLSAVKRSNLPMLFIHGEEDTFVPYQMVYELYEAKPGDNKDMLVIPGAEHAMSSTVDEGAYWDKVQGFLMRYFH